MKTRTDARQLRDQQELRAEMAAMFDDIVRREPDAVLVLAKCGKDLVVRAGGEPTSVLRLYTETTDVIEGVIRQLIATAAGVNNG